MRKLLTVILCLFLVSTLAIFVSCGKKEEAPPAHTEKAVQPEEAPPAQPEAAPPAHTEAAPPAQPEAAPPAEQH